MANQRRAGREFQNDTGTPTTVRAGDAMCYSEVGQIQKCSGDDPAFPLMAGPECQAMVNGTESGLRHRRNRRRLRKQLLPSGMNWRRQANCNTALDLFRSADQTDHLRGCVIIPAGQAEPAQIGDDTNHGLL